jgi:iron(III) transport system ATP-binding protein
MALSISLVHLTKTFTKDRQTTFKAVDDVHLDVMAGELVTLLGPSGCGKTTILRMIAGFEKPTKGRVLIGGQDITDMAVNERDIGFIFQNYALFPHMNVFDNVAYGLKVRHTPQTETETKVAETLDLVGLKGVEKRFPNQLSGGEQQRVALARVFAINPNVLLMDEPLANLDAKLRIYMLAEIRSLQKRLGATCIFVTHDQKEALAIADRIVVLNKGRIEQAGTPFELYANPASFFVADFIGQANIFRGRIEAVSEGELDVSFYGRSLGVRCNPGASFRKGDEVALAIRPDSLALGKTEGSMLAGQVLSRVFVGDKMEYVIEVEPGFLVHLFEPYSRDNQGYPVGSRVGISVDPRDVIPLPV